MNCISLFTASFRINNAIDRHGELLKPIADKRQISAFPIPAKRFVTVVVPFDFSKARLTVHDLGGRLLHQQSMKRRTEIVDMKHRPQGIFIVQVVADKHTMERKIVKDE